MKKNANKGFSLVELIIVIAIMAVLIGVLAPQFIKQVEKSRESTDLQNVEEYKTAVETYVSEHGEDDDLPTEIYITAGKTANTIALTVKDGSCDLSDYGLDDSKDCKSKKWTQIKWTYDTSTYKWSASPAADANGADAFNWDGTTR